MRSWIGTVFQRLFPPGGLAPALRAACRWSPFAFALCLVALLGIGGRLAYGLEFLSAMVLLGAAWFAGRRLWPLALIALAVLALPAYHLAVHQPRVAGELRQAPPGGYVRVRGTIRGQTPRLPESGEHLRLLLGEAELRVDGRVWPLLEVEVAFPVRRRRRRPFPFGREIRLGGELRGVTGGGRLGLKLAGVEYHMAARPIVPWRGETLRMALRNRAGYYLSEPALAVYLPILLGVRERRSPEAREVVSSFRRVGISHLFAISGLHIGLLLLIFLAAAHLLSGLLLRGQGPLHGRAISRVAAVGLVWGYIALIGFPVPAVRAAIMASMLLWSGLWGTRTPPLYLLWLAGLILVAITPTIVYNLSFQLSFLAFFFLLIALQARGALWEAPPPRAREEAGPETDATPARLAGLLRRWRTRPRTGFFSAVLRLVTLNLAVTFSITAGIWPLIAMHFGQVSFLVFLGNLLMIPLLSLVVLPGGLAALLVSLAHLDGVPGGWLERLVFGAMEGVLQGWLWAIRLIDRAGGGLVVPIRLDWGAREFFLYYALLGGAILLFRRLAAGKFKNFF